MLVDDALRQGGQTVVCEFVVNNTESNLWNFEDWVGSNLMVGGSAVDYNYKDNSFQQVSNAQPLNSYGTEAVVEGFSDVVDLPEPFDSAVATQSYSYLQIDPRGDDYLNRNFDDANITVKVGGVLNKGKPNEQELEYEDYPTWVNGRISAFDFDTEVITLKVDSKSDDLSANFPPNVYTEGDLEGQAKPVVYGFAGGVRPKMIETGVWQYHDGSLGLADTSDQIYTFPPVFYVGYGRDFYENIYFIFRGDPAATGPSRGPSDFTWIQNGTQEVVSNTDIVTSVKVSGDQIVANSDGDSFTISKSPSAPKNSFNGNGFTWVLENPQRAVSRTQPKIIVTTTGATKIVLVGGSDPRFGGQWFKIDGPGTGTVNFEFEEKLLSVDLYARAIRNPLNVIDNWSKEPTSITPPYNTDGVVYNHLIKIRQINSKTLTFDYTDQNSIDLSAIWFERVTFATPRIQMVDIDFDRLIVNPVLAVNQNSELDTISNTTLPISGTVTAGQFADRTFTGKTETLSFKVDLGRGPVTFKMSDIKDDLGELGAYKFGDLIRLKPPPEFQDDLFGDPVTGMSAGEAIVSFSHPATPGKSTLRFKARITAGEVDKTNLLVQSNSEAFAVEVGREWKIIEIDESFQGGANISAFRGTRPYVQVGGSAAGLTNSLGEVTVDIEFAELVPTQDDIPDVSVLVVAQGLKRRIPTYRVDSARQFSDPPQSITIYDDSGYIVSNHDYTEIFANVVGIDKNIRSIDAFRKISRAATERDLITCDFAGEVIGGFFDVQRPFIQHISEICEGLDYFYIEDPVDDGVSINRRFQYGESANDFVIEKEQIADDSVRRLETGFRQYQYIVNYQTNYSFPEQTKSSRSGIGFSLSYDPRIIPTFLTLKSDAENIASRIFRDSAQNSIYSARVKGVGLGIKVGHAGKINHPLVPRSKPCIVSKVAQDTYTQETELRFKVLQGRGVYV